MIVPGICVQSELMSSWMEDVPQEIAPHMALLQDVGFGPRSRTD